MKKHSRKLGTAALVLFCLGALFWFYSRSAGREVYDIVLIAGQSNSTSAGEGLYSDPEARRAREKDIFQVGRFAPNDHQIIAATDDLQDWDFPRNKKHSSIGFGMAFARRYAESCLGPDRRLLLISGGLGGSSILEWDDVVDFPGDSSTLLDDLLSRARWAKNLNPANRIVGMLWHQGESDIGRSLRESFPSLGVQAWRSASALGNASWLQSAGHA